MPQPLRPALFLDRDGVINEEIGYLHRFQDVRFVPGARELIQAANRRNMPVIVVTNQAGIGRGLYTEAQFHTLMHGMREALQQQGAQLDAVYFSPFHPEHGLGQYRQDTECRKPRPGMLLRAAQEHGISLSDSILVGDRCSDMEAAAAAGVSHRFLLQGTEAELCTGATHITMPNLETVTRWLTTQYPAAYVTAEEGGPRAIPA